MKKQKKVKKTREYHPDFPDGIDPLDRDMSDFILEGIRNNSWQLVKFELREPKSKVISLRLSETLLKEVKEQAKNMGLDTQKFIRIALETVIRKKVG